MSHRIAFALILMLLGPVAMAAGAPDLPSIFQPVTNDLSMWYLGNIFGNDLVPGQNVPNIMLLSNLFGVFNQVVLAVGLIIVVYTFFTGTLNTAAEGKAMGEKWHSLWIPIRIATGVGMLIPKAGSGYCMAQYIVMWLTIQGIGAADSVWTKMLEYFEKGGSIYSTQVAAPPETNFTYDNMDYTYALQSSGQVGSASQDVSLLRSMVCVDKFNSKSDIERDNAEFTVYTPTGFQNLLVFGNKAKFDYPRSGDMKEVQGAECGIIKLGTSTGKNNNLPTGAKTSHQQMVDHTYITGIRYMMDSLKDVAKAIAEDKTDTVWSRYYLSTNLSMQLYVNYIVSYSKSLVPATTNQSNVVNLSLFKEYGWLLAGNYYTLLSHLGDKAQPATAGTFVMPGAAGVDSKFEYFPPKNKDSTEDMETTKQITDYFKGFANDPRAMYNAPNSEWQQEQASKQASYTASASSGSATSPIKNNDMQQIADAVGATNSDQLTGVTAQRTKEFIKYLAGDRKGGLVAQDPILAAAKEGKRLTEASIALMVTFSAAWTVGMLLAAPMSCLNSGGYALQAAGDILVPMMMALGAFMYAEGAMLGVFVPVIPYLTFLTGVVGYFLSVIESVAAAPIVAIGLILPETKDDIWGRAAPAYMLTLNLFLRPSLMIIGFAAAMMVTWVTVEILNIGFLTLVSGTFRIENMFGFVTIMMAYTAVFIYVITESYSLINVLPNKVLHWIGDQSQGVKGAEEAIGGAKQGAEAGGRATAAGAGAFNTKADMYRATAHAKQAHKKFDDPGTGVKNDEK